jgi:hypothetical protein
LYNDRDSVATLHNCTFTHNYLNDGAAGILNEGVLLMTDCLLDRNTASEDAGGVLNTGVANVERCTFVGNSGFEDGGYAGGFTNWGTALLNTCSFYGNWHGQDGAVYSSGDTTLINSVVYGMQGSYGCGGVMVWDGTTRVVNTICASNGRGFLVYGGRLDLANSIVWGNEGDGASTELDQILVYEDGTASVRYTCIEGLDRYAGNGNIGTDPRFVRNPDDGGDGWGDDQWTPDIDEAANDDYGNLRLSPGSPCIDAGDNFAVPDWLLSDLDGMLRFWDDPDTPDTGNPDGVHPVVDMGPYEFGSEGCPDEDGDGFVTICHIPPGRPERARTITIPIPAVPAHLAHGDYCGPCNTDSDSERPTSGHRAPAEAFISHESAERERSP